MAQSHAPSNSSNAGFKARAPPEGQGQNLVLTVLQGQNLVLTVLQGQNLVVTVLYGPCLLDSGPSNSSNACFEVLP